MDVALRQRRFELARPLETAAGRIDRRTVFLVRVERDGVAGVGEAAPLAGWTESVEDCRRALETLVERLPDDPGEAMTAVEDAPAAGHGIRTAIGDRAARVEDRPLYRHLGGPERRERVPVNATLGDAPPGDTADAARRAVEAGFRTLKCKVGARPVEEDVARLRAVREAVDDETPGGAVALRADANGAWTLGQARTAFEDLRELGVDYVEQPLEPGDLEGLRSLRGGGVGVAVDESLRDHDPRTILGADAADVVVVKPMAAGGPREAVRVARLARNNGLRAVLTTTVDAAPARTAAVHCAAAVPVDDACGLATAGRLATDLPDPAPVEDGAIRVPQEPGVAGADAVERWWSE